MHKRLLQVGLVAFGWLLMCASWATHGQTPGKKAGATAKAAQIVEAPEGFRGVRFEPGNRRDPFLNPLLLKKNEYVDEEAPRGTPPPGIAGMYINQVELLGFSVSADGKTAVFKGIDKRVYFLREGDHLFDGYLKSITLEFAQLIRETKLTSGKVVTQDITRRLRTP
jgi:hypothetical protein